MPIKQRLVFENLSADAFITDADKRALDSLKKLPLLPAVIKKFSELGLDRWMYSLNMASAVRCGPNQFSTLYGIFQESCKILDLPEPELYVTGNPFPNAFAGGVERPYITIRSSMLDTLTNEQLYHLIGHELGHIKSGHLLYHVIGRLLIPLLQAIGRRLPIIGDAAAIGLVFAFYEWMRQSELSCDRAGLLVSQDINISLNANLALTAGPSRFSNEASIEPFLEQARAFEEAKPLDQLGRILLYFTFTWAFTHPMPVFRSKELEAWADTSEFRKIMRGIYPKNENLTANNN